MLSKFNRFCYFEMAQYYGLAHIILSIAVQCQAANCMCRVWYMYNGLSPTEIQLMKSCFHRAPSCQTIFSKFPIIRSFHIYAVAPIKFHFMTRFYAAVINRMPAQTEKCKLAWLLSPLMYMLLFVEIVYFTLSTKGRRSWC